MQDLSRPSSASDAILLAIMRVSHRVDDRPVKGLELAHPAKKSSKNNYALGRHLRKRSMIVNQV